MEAIIECAGEDSERLDAIVEEVYQRSRRLLPPAERQKLVRSQRIWRATREKRCTPKGKIAMFEVWQIYNCLALKSIDRIEWLDRRIGTASNSRRD
ncbi:MAG: hypothetical protein A4S12_00855 [Proteobacteria bacterium SG_bin5]|nr:MAG: hypothetical protein A4S12_00855 [Proteobacteria bacterium SG_bin5]